MRAFDSLSGRWPRLRHGTGPRSACQSARPRSCPPPDSTGLDGCGMEPRIADGHWLPDLWGAEFVSGYGQGVQNTSPCRSSIVTKTNRNRPGVIRQAACVASTWIEVFGHAVRVGEGEDQFLHDGSALLNGADLVVAPAWWRPSWYVHWPRRRARVQVRNVENRDVLAHPRGGISRTRPNRRSSEPFVQPCRRLGHTRPGARATRRNDNARATICRLFAIERRRIRRPAAKPWFAHARHGDAFDGQRDSPIGIWCRLR